ncbi:MAG TPA: diversity-generating retroelement protein Avd [Gemmataceae bacterium]|nr:diversity-generating retroelement protein Avd [Gemmataceae bacterium]
MTAPGGGELIVITRAYDLVLWSCQRVAKFPRSYRETLGDRLEVRLYDVLDGLLRARYTRDRQAILQGVNLSLEQLRYSFRLAKDLRCLSLDGYEHAARLVNEVGQMVGGWLKRGGRGGDEGEAARQPVG